MSPHPLTLADAPVLLYPERALAWPAGRTLLVADLHLDKPEALRRAYVAAPLAATRADLDRLSRLVSRCHATHLVILGDLYHAPGGAGAPATAEALRSWRNGHPTLEITLVLGNHDRRAGPPPAGLGLRVVPEGTPYGPFVLRHHPGPDPRGYVLAGHLHPGVHLTGPGDDALRLPCFRVGPRQAILPAFGALTGLDIRPPAPGEVIYAIADNSVVALSGPTR